MKVLRQTPHSDATDLGQRSGEAQLWWLGQAGFLIELAGNRIVIDPYLSDSLAEKYKGRTFPHIRMMPAPVAPEQLTDIDLILCTHAHTDHMDPGTLPGLITANPRARVIVPRSTIETALERGVPADNLVPIDAGERFEQSCISIVATPAAHEELARDDAGYLSFLGYIISGQGCTIWHSGDTIPFPGLVEAVAPHLVDLALLPVNGRDEIRSSSGVPGNLSLAEALDLSERIGTRAMIGHHLDLFEFNTLDRASGEAQIRDASTSFAVTLAKVNTRYSIEAPLQKNLRILTVCRGNICRSPLAEAVLRDKLAGFRVEIDSAAIEDWNVGKAPDERAIDTARKVELDISNQRARQVTAEDFERFDLIIGMDQANMTALRDRCPAGSRARLVMMGNFAEVGRDVEIEDPYYGDAEVFDACLTEVTKAACSLKRKLFSYN